MFRSRKPIEKIEAEVPDKRALVGAFVEAVCARAEALAAGDDEEKKLASLLATTGTGLVVLAEFDPANITDKFMDKAMRLLTRPPAEMEGLVRAEMKSIADRFKIKPA